MISCCSCQFIVILSQLISKQIMMERLSVFVVFLSLNISIFYQNQAKKSHSKC